MLSIIPTPPAGLTWLFALLSVDGSLIVFDFLFCIFNSIQGFLIFVFLNIRDKAVRDAWLRCFRRLRKKGRPATTGIGSGGALPAAKKNGLPPGGSPRSPSAAAKKPPSWKGIVAAKKTDAIWNSQTESESQSSSTGDGTIVGFDSTTSESMSAGGGADAADEPEALSCNTYIYARNSCYRIPDDK